MSRDLKDEDAVVSGVDELACGRAAKRKPTQHKWPRVKGKLLLMILALLANEVDGIEVFKPALRDADERCTKTQAVSD